MSESYKINQVDILKLKNTINLRTQKMDLIDQVQLKRRLMNWKNRLADNVQTEA